MFRKDADFEAFERVMIEAHERHPIRIFSCGRDCMDLSRSKLCYRPGRLNGRRTGRLASTPH
jgi:hypothetical protein